MDFKQVIEEVEPGFGINPFAARTADGEWIPGLVSLEFLQAHFGQYETAREMKAATESEGLKRLFDWLVEQGKIPQ